MNINTRFLPVWISLKFILNSSQSKHIKVITLTTIIGLTLGVSSLITVLSIMNGFTSIAKHRITNLIPHITINTSDNSKQTTQTTQTTQSADKIKNLKKIISNKLGNNKIQDIYPDMQKKGFIINNNHLIPIWINALPSYIIEKKLATLNNNINNDDLDSDSDYYSESESGLESETESGSGSKVKNSQKKAKPNNIKATKNYNGLVLSTSILEQLDSNKNVSFITSDNFFKYYNVDIKNSFAANDQFMGHIAFIDINYASQLFNDPTISNLNVDLVYPNKAPSEAEKLMSEIPLDITNWTVYTGNYFSVLEYTKQMMFILLSFIVLVAMFNLIATMTTVLNQKQAELAILKTLGINNSFIIKLFLSYGFIITSIGLILGLLFGFLLVHNISFLSGLIEHLFDYKFVNPEIYFINYLPAKISNSDVFNIISLVYITMLIVIIYPSIKASRIMPARALMTLR